jgi:hypothetical protein
MVVMGRPPIERLQGESRMKSELGTDGSLAGEAMLTSGEFDKISDVLRATTTAASIF